MTNVVNFGKDWQGIKKCAAQNGRHNTGRGVNPCVMALPSRREPRRGGTNNQSAKRKSGLKSTLYAVKKAAYSSSNETFLWCSA